MSVVVEAYNEEANALAPPHETFQALLQQDFPLEQAELILIGSEQQVTDWQRRIAVWPRFQRVRLLTVESANSHYWNLKNKAAECAEGEILALIDCDAVPGPHWLSAGVKALQQGADASIGPTLYRTDKLPPDSPWMMAAALPSWSFALRLSPAEGVEANALLAHNLVIRRCWLLEHPFPVVRRSFASSLEFFALRRAGAKFSYQPEQKVAHAMNFRWWLSRMHFRRGWETYEGRRADSSWPRLRALQQLSWVEPVVLRMGLVCRDAGHWFCFSRVLGISRTKASLLFPIVVVASLFARSAEMIGMYAAMLAPRATEHQARF